MIDSYHEKALLYLLESKQIVVFQGDTQCIPQVLYQAGINKVVVVRSKRGFLGQTAGIEFVRGESLIREMLIDPMLKAYSVIVIDKAHERNLITDLLLSLVRCILLKRNDLKIIICSATTEVGLFVKFFTRSEESVPAVLLNGNKDKNRHLTKILYRSQPVANYLDTSVDIVKGIHETCRLAGGKILIFMTGIDEVEYVCRRLDDYSLVSENRLDLKRLLVMPLHSSLRAEQMASVFEEHGKNTRVCIVSTNIAETSHHIEGVRFVIDCGFVKLKLLDRKTGIDSLIRVPLSKNSAKLRALRANDNSRKNYVYRLYPESEYEKLGLDAVPEIQRSSLTEAILLLKSLGVRDLPRFPMLAPMPRTNMVAGLDILHALQAIDDEGRITETGELMAHLDLEPRVAKMLVSYQSIACIREVCRIAAIIQMRDIYEKPARQTVTSLWTNESLVRLCATEGDILSYLNILDGFVKNQESRKWAEKRFLNHQVLTNTLKLALNLEEKLRRHKIKITNAPGRSQLISKAILSGFFLNAAFLDSTGSYKTISSDKIVHIHPTSVYSDLLIDDRPMFIIYGEMVETDKPYIRHLMAVEKDWLLETAPHYFHFK